MSEYTKRAISANSIQGAMRFVEQDNFNEKRLGQLRIRLKNLNEHWNKFIKSQEAILNVAEIQEFEENTNIFEETEHLYLEAKGALCDRIRYLKQHEIPVQSNENNFEANKSASESVQTENEILPKHTNKTNNEKTNQIVVQYPASKSVENTWGEFDGNLMQWQGFHDRFRAAIHENEQLSGAYKFMYLQRSLTGKASYALGEWQLTDDNYTEAWERLKQLYERKYQTSAELFRKFRNMPKLNYANGAMIQKLSNITHETLRQLKALNHPIEHYDSFVVLSIHEKSDSETGTAWELCRASEYPTVQELLSFLDRQAKALSNTHFFEQ